MENEEDEDEDENEDENEDDDDDDGVLYTQQRWAPPTVSIPDYHIQEEDDLPNLGKLLQRGCSWDMLHSFDVSYSHGSGIVVTLRSLEHLYASGDEDEDDNADDISMYRVFLGWNIALDPDDTDGENYISRDAKGDQGSSRKVGSDSCSRNALCNRCEATCGCGRSRRV